MPKLLASDTPQPNSSLKGFGVQPVQSQDTSKASTSIAQNAISSTGMFLDNSLQKQAQTAQSIMQSSSQAQESIARSESQAIGTERPNNFAAGLKSIAAAGTLVASTLKGIEERDTKAKAAYQKSEYDKAHASALQEVSVLQVDAQDRFINGVGGRVSVERDFQGILNKYELSSDDKAKIVNDFYGTIIPLENDSAKRQRTETDKIEDQKIEQKTKELGIFLSTTTSALSVASSPEEVDQQFGRFNSVIQQTVTDPRLSPKERQALLLKGYTMLETATFQSSDAQAKARQALENMSAYSAQAADLAEEYKQTGDRPAYDNKRFLLQQQYKIEDKYADTYDPDKSRRDVNQVEADKQRTDELRHNREAIIFDNTLMGELTVGNTANQYASDPAAYAKFKASPQGKTATGQSILAVADLAIKQRKDMLGLREDSATIELAKQNVIEGNLKDLISSIRSSKPDKPNPLLLIPSISQTLTSEVMARLSASNQESPEYKAALQQAESALSAKKGDIINALDGQLRAKEDTVASQGRQLEKYGWRGGQYNQGAYEMGVKKQEEAISKQQAQKNAEDVVGNGGVTPGFRAPTLKTANVGGKTAYLPFGVQANLLGRSNNYGENRGDHVHAGEDIQVPVGTPIVAPMDGIVKIVSDDPKGYGYFVEVKFGDGTSQLYAHMSKQMVREGQRVKAGQIVGKSGGDPGAPGAGRSSGAHLHWEVRGTNDQVINPYSWATTFKPGSSLRGVRSADAGQSRPANIPKDAIAMAGGYLLTKAGRTMFYPRGQVQGTSARYSASSPIRGNQNSINVKDYAKRNDPNANHGYSVLSQDKGFAREVARVSDKIGVPSQWLTDVMAYETGGTFDPAIKNRGGAPAYGLIQFYDDAGRPGGKTIGDRFVSNGELRAMSRVQQMKLVEQYMTPFKGRMRSPGDVLEAIFHGTVGELSDSTGDGDITFGAYKAKLGEHAGRKYYGAGGSNRQARALSKVHTVGHVDCPLCNQMLASSGSIIPHEAMG